MTSSMSTILLFGGTGGIGESFARAFNKMGKKVIITGRREDRLATVAKEVPGLETYAMDNSDLAALPKHVETILSKWPNIDTVWVNSGIQYQGNFKSLVNFSDEKIINEINTNLTAPVILARHFIPHLISLKREANFLITSSGIAFVPFGMFPVYSPTKAGVHSFLVGLRQTLKDTNVNVIEIVPPYVRTDLDAENRLWHVITPMELDDYTQETLKVLEKPAKEIKEAPAGSSAKSVQAWREAFDPVLAARGASD
ncbi:short-chain dehydrogenase/reductase-like protein SDR [Exophiala viscosa]|uniref:Short-chain dehydrogenase/reductase-like protein SDR n=1 Tax=Exophiala viscosa TaxID=2486360 RepID=A0AAN6DW81_9EURO|nr:short-chain dehydrogenase/reductase-like protein SDR [Exophiala viscosa]KAI1619891.1 short-chain dehydrogenase/reductase-like protein SDR [Exophiala viscosa]